MIEDFITSEFSIRSKFLWDFHINFKELNKWLMYAKLFEDWHNNKNLETQKKNLIPKKIHHIWLGEKSLPPYFEKFRKSWKKNNPDYEFYYWDDSKCKDLSLINRKLFDSIKNKGCKSDILRYEILYKYGGIYVDTDFECIKPIPKELLKKHFVCCMQFNYKPEIGNSFIMSEPKNILLKSIIENCSYPKNESIENIIKNSGPGMLTNQISKNLLKEKDKILILPSNYCFPIPSFIKDVDSPNNFLTNDSFAIHHWKTTWIKSNRIRELKSALKSFIKSIIDFYNKN